VKVTLRILILALILPIILSAYNDEEFDYKFIQADTCCSFRGSFIVNCQPGVLIDLIYDYDKISEYSPGVKTLELVRQGEDWYEVAFTYQDLLVLENRSVWRRTLNREENTIEFELISNWNNTDIIPELLSSTGHYKLKSENDECLVEIFQECKLHRGLLNDAYFKKVKKEGTQFLRVFKDFIERNCD